MSALLYRGGSRIFKISGGVYLKKLRRAERGAKNFGVFRVKNHDFTPKNHIFYNFRGGCVPGAPAPDIVTLRPSVRPSVTSL